MEGKEDRLGVCVSLTGLTVGRSKFPYLKGISASDVAVLEPDARDSSQGRTCIAQPV